MKPRPREDELSAFVSLLLDALEIDEVADLVTTIVLRRLRAQQATQAASGVRVSPVPPAPPKTTTIITARGKRYQGAKKR
jgi:hypothetical protein